MANKSCVRIVARISDFNVSVLFGAFCMSTSPKITCCCHFQYIWLKYARDLLSYTNTLSLQTPAPLKQPWNRVGWPHDDGLFSMLIEDRFRALSRVLCLVKSNDEISRTNTHSLVEIRRRRRRLKLEVENCTNSICVPTNSSPLHQQSKHTRAVRLAPRKSI